LLVAWRVLVSYSFNKFVKVILLLLGSWVSDVKGESKEGGGEVNKWYGSVVDYILWS
jgi:hypothetical protein